MAASPGQGCIDSLGGIALSMHRGSQHPTDFRDGSERRTHVSLVIAKTDLSYKVSRRFFLNQPKTESKNRPMTGVAEKTGPALFQREWLASNVFRDRGISP